jgi:hypothetical protein
VKPRAVSTRTRVAGVALMGLGASLLAPAPVADAKITSVVITKKVSPAFDGKSFGTVGQYEELEGTAFGELDPRDPLNALITDIELAPRNARGMVEYSMDIGIVKPIDMSKSNATLFYEDVNRGNKNSPSFNVGGSPTAIGDGWLQTQGYTLAWAGWEGDITTGVRIKLPVARNADGSELTGRVRAEYIINTRPTPSVNVTAEPAYEAASLNNAGATLTRRARQGDPKEAIDNAKWAFADCSTTPFPGKPDATKVCLVGGFGTNHIYELIYTAKNPTVTGVGFAANRDFVAFLRGDQKNVVQSPQSPLGDAIKQSIIYGSSQSGRWIRTFLHLGFNESENHTKVFDGAFPHKASNRGAFNIRFAQPTRLSGTQHTELQYPGQESPQTWDVSQDTISNVKGGQLDRCRKSNTCPKIMATETDTEYWQALMALNTTDSFGEVDYTIPPEVRIYLFAGTQHGGGNVLAQPPATMPQPPGHCQLPANSHSFLPAQRALLVAMQEWIVNGKEPPASRYPTIRNRTLVPVNDIKYPYMPAKNFTVPGIAAQRVYLDRGPGYREADASGVMNEPPVTGKSYAVLQPQVDADGNTIDGMRSTTLQAPLGTYLGWNVRKAGFSEGDSCDLTGGFIPFFKTQAERMAAGDPRPSLQERYPTHDAYVAKVTAAAQQLVADRFLLQVDANLLIDQAKAAQVP